LLLALACQMGLALVWVSQLGSQVDFALMTGVVNLVALTAIAAVGYWRSGEAPRVFPVGEIPMLYWLGLVLTAASGTVVLGEIANLTTWVLPLPGWLAKVFGQLSDGPPLISLFTLAFVAPVTEESIFRGLLLRGFARRYGNGAGIVLASSLFAVFHLNIWQAMTAFLAGLYLGWVYISTRSLLPSMLAHGLFNGLPVLLAALGFVVSGYNSPPVSTPVFQPLFWTAGGLVVLAAGLALTKRWAPLSPPPVSDRVLS